MFEVFIKTDSRYKIERRFVKAYLTSVWKEKNLPNGTLSVAFVGARKAKQMASKYLHDQEAHPVLTFPYNKTGADVFPGEDNEKLLGEIVICYPQVTLYATDNNREINKVIVQFLDHAVSILKGSY